MRTTKIMLQTAEVYTTRWMRQNGDSMLRISIGIIFFWFGILKFFPGASPAQDLAIRTISLLTFGILPASVIINMLALWEVVIGIGFITGKYLKTTLLLLFAQMLGTFTPVFLFPAEVFTAIPYAPTLEGQYIIKNIVIVSAGFVIGAKVFGNSQKNKAQTSAV